MGLSIAGTLLSIGVIISIGIGGYTGITEVSASSSLCSSYLTIKYNVCINQIYLSSFVMAVISTIASLMVCVFAIRLFMRYR